MKFDSRLLRQLNRVRVFLTLTILLGFVIGILTIAQARVLSQAIDQVFLKGASLDAVWKLMLALLAIFGARAVLMWGSEVTAFQIAARIKTDLRQRVFNHLAALGPAYVRGERTGELANTLVEGIEALDAYLSQYLPQLVLAVLVPISILIFVFPLDVLSGVVLLVTGPLIPLFMILIGSAADALTRKQYQSLSRMSAHFLDVLQGLTTLKIFGRSREQINTIAEVSEQFRDTTLSVLRVAFLSAFALEMIATISTAIVAVEVGVRLLYGQMEFEQAFFVLILAPDFYLPLRLLGTRFHAGMAGVAAAARIFEILETTTDADESPPQVAIRPSRQPITDPRSETAVSGCGRTSSASSSVVFNDVHFSYNSTRTALNGISFKIAPGQHSALVGATGAGKSTIVNLLLGFIKPDRGEIFIDGVLLGDPSSERWQSQIAWVPQMPYLFNESVADNIRLARPNAAQEEIVQAAQRAHADEFIRDLPQEYDTIVGERGTRLSGGQAQRIALARAFLRDAPLLILDEATSQLDVENAAAIQSAVDHLLENRTALIITHRLENIKRADQIIVLDNGCVAEIGTHESLTQQRGVYHQMVTGEVPSDKWQVTSKVIGDECQVMNIGLATENPKSAIANHTPRHSTPATLLRLLKLAAPFAGWIALAVLLGSLTIGSSIGLLATSAFIIASAALHPSIADLAVPIVGVRFIGIARGVFRYLERYVSHYVNFSLLARLRVWFYTAIEPLAPARLQGYRSGDLLTRIVGDIETLQNFYVRIIAPPLIALVIAGVMFVFFAGFSFTIALVVLMFMLLVGIVTPVVVQRISHSTNRSLIRTRSELNAHLVDGIQGIADLIAFGRAKDYAARIDGLSRRLTQCQTRMASIAGLHSATSNLFIHLAMWIVLALAIPLVANSQLAGVYLPVLALAVLSSFEGVLALPAAFQYLESNVQAAERLFEIADQPPTADERLQIKMSSSLRSSVVPLIRVDNLSFRYAPNESLALDNISFDLASGQHLAIVGPSGAGKSTIANLLLQFWNYDKGSILVDGRELRDYAPEDVRRFFSVVTQSTHLFNTTIRDNLLLARPRATETEMIRAAQQAQIHDTICALPQGYNTWIGEQGLALSGGERQRLAVARALLKEAPIVLLDEATANLDGLTERAVWTALETLLQRSTAIVITHRLTGLANMDEIIVLQAGRVTERGTHAQLVQRTGWYRRMWELTQA